jgi:Tol biopolymer transport system component
MREGVLRIVAALAAVIAALATPVAPADGSPAATQRASVSTDGAEGNADSVSVAVSGDGRLVAFSSLAANLVPGDTNGGSDVFLRDLSARVTERASVALDGSEADGDSFDPAVSENGRVVAFATWARNLAPDGAHGAPSIVARDLATGALALVSIGENDRPVGGTRPALSADGSRVAFVGIDGVVRVRDLARGVTLPASVAADGALATGESPSLSGDGRLVAFASWSPLSPDDLDEEIDVYVRDLESGALLLASRGDRFLLAFAPALSLDGRSLAFMAQEPPIVHAASVVVLDLATGDVDALPRAAEPYDRVSPSADGRLVAFTSPGFVGAGGCFAGVYVWDRVARDIALATVDVLGAPAAPALEESLRPALSADGRTVAFESRYPALVAGDTNGAWDAFGRAWRDAPARGPCVLSG